MMSAVAKPMLPHWLERSLALFLQEHLTNTFLSWNLRAKLLHASESMFLSLTRLALSAVPSWILQAGTPNPVWQEVMQQSYTILSVTLSMTSASEAACASSTKLLDSCADSPSPMAVVALLMFFCALQHAYLGGSLMALESSDQRLH